MVRPKGLEPLLLATLAWLVMLDPEVSGKMG